MLTAERFERPRIRALAFAVGLLVLTPITSVALELGEATVRSGLGQPLVVEIPYRLANDERLAPTCISLVPATRLDDALPTYSRVSSIAITRTHIEIFGDGRVLEPLIGLTVAVRCRTAPHFQRNFELFVDPPAMGPQIRSNGTQFAAARVGAASELRPESSTTAPTAAVTSGSPASTEPASTPRTAASTRARGYSGGNLAQGQSYLVVRGDTLSGIAARIGDRQTTINETAEAIFAANPAAFTRGDRNLLRAGHSITIPIMAAAEEAPPAQTSEAAPPRAELSPAPVPPVAVPEIVEAPAATVPVEQPSAPPAPLPSAVAPDRTSPVTAERTSIWWVALLALGVVIVLSAGLLFARRRKPEAAPPERAPLRSAHPRQLVDPVAGIDVIEERSPTVSTSTYEVSAPPRGAVTGPASLAVAIGADDPIDLDVGVPVSGDESAATAQFPGPASAATVQHEQPEPKAEVTEPDIDDVQHTLTIAEIDILRQDWETEHTLTQESSKTLRAAVAELKATQAALAASADTATLKIPQRPQAETEEAEPAPIRRSAH